MFVRRLFRSRFGTQKFTTKSFDSIFYGTYYDDLKGFTNSRTLFKHYAAHGRHEGRFPHARALMAALSSEFGPLPTDFVPEQYRLLNEDLTDFHEGWALAEHYLRFGRAEGRAYLLADDFDAAFYQRRYRDLSGVPDEELTWHYLKFGRREGRAPNALALVAALEKEFGPIPADFVPDQYRRLYGDLSGKGEPWELKEHYLRYGRSEGRSYRRIRNKADEEDLASLRAIAAKAGVLPEPVLDHFMRYEFAVLNANWLPHAPRSRLEGIRLFLEQGVERLAPISMKATFDPNFYRLQLSGPAPSRDADLYRAWLSFGLDDGVPGSERSALLQLLGEDRFPACFDDADYRAGLAMNVGQPPAGRFAALKHFVEGGFIDRDMLAGLGGAALFSQISDFHLIRNHNALALEAAERGLALAPRERRLLHQRADALRALGRGAEATADYVAAADLPGAGLWTHIHAALGLAADPLAHQAALDRIERSAKYFRGASAWRGAAHQTIARVFATVSAEARALYAAGRRTEADTRLTACLDRLATVIAVVDPLPGRLPPLRNGRIVMVANRDLPQCDHYRVVQKCAQLEHGGWTVELFRQDEADQCRPSLDRAAAVIFYRVAAIPGVLHAILYARALGLPTIYEIDDLLFEPAFYPDPFESFEGQITEQDYVGLQYGVPLFRYALRLCDAGIASTPALAEAMRPHLRTGTCHVLRNGLDQRNDPFLARPATPFANGPVTVFYGSGTKAHNRDFTILVAPALLEVLARHAHVRIVIAGYLHLDPRFAPFADRVLQLGYCADVTAYWEVLSGADINLAVLVRGPMADAKSEIKWLEAAMCGVPSIVSGTRTYRELLSDGEDALLADSPGDWLRALDRLIVDHALRRAIGERARARALGEYGFDAAEAVLAQALPPPGAPEHTRPRPKELRPRPYRPDAERKPRVLILNVYFPPQLVGGATRVVRDNLDHFLDHAGDRFEFAVAAADDGAEPAHGTRIDQYRGVPVYRIAPPHIEHGGWQAFDPGMREPFEALLDRFAPDLVHVHCVQHLTGTVVESVRARGVPYVITLHDAWWISDFQFLIDLDGQVHTPSPDPLADATNRSLDPIASLARRRTLGRLLDDAHALIAVSESFAGLYQAAGHSRTFAIANGVPAMSFVPRRPGSAGRVRLGQIGGRTTHKGATLIESVLRAGSFSNLDLTLVDHARAPGETSTEIWGTTPVRLIGRQPQDSIAELYAELDVLLAPSLWPESYGLVTREARAAGLWVVASDRGAIGADLIEDVDGFRIDVESPEGLRNVLSRMDNDPVRFSQSPPLMPDTERTTADQGNDLLELYDRIIAFGNGPSR
ncbi:glycosyltransferase [Methylobacterium sp. Leaf87]|uniref:glycosyltransferase n=1 Tax=Methylobacterium sp. Leaf87 TaxID=1736243 RepID=UPI000B11DAF9|nr:glycosyltransferase [Methylobacterium sp. Leaf87]